MSKELVSVTPVVCPTLNVGRSEWNSLKSLVQSFRDTSTRVICTSLGENNRCEKNQQPCSFLKNSSIITAEDERQVLQNQPPQSSQSLDIRIELPEEGLDLTLMLEAVEKQYIQLALQKGKGRVTRAAELLRVNRRTLLRRLQQYGLHYTDDK